MSLLCITVMRRGLGCHPAACMCVQLMGMVFESIKQPVINGYLVAGAIVGPGGLQLIKELVQASEAAAAESRRSGSWGVQPHWQQRRTVDGGSCAAVGLWQLPLSKGLREWDGQPGWLQDGAAVQSSSNSELAGCN